MDCLVFRGHDVSYLFFHLFLCYIMESMICWTLSNQLVQGIPNRVIGYWYSSVCRFEMEGEGQVEVFLLQMEILKKN